MEDKEPMTPAEAGTETPKTQDQPETEAVQAEAVAGPPNQRPRKWPRSPRRSRRPRNRPLSLLCKRRSRRSQSPRAR